jgi:exosome complex RNA-binding protein Rrp42 (RNase PH superfamily)
LIINKGKVLKTIGWATVSIGFYMVILGVKYDDSEPFKPRRYNEDIIDAVFTVIDD